MGIPEVIPAVCPDEQGPFNIDGSLSVEVGHVVIITFGMDTVSLHVLHEAVLGMVDVPGIVIMVSVAPDDLLIVGCSFINNCHGDFVDIRDIPGYDQNRVLPGFVPGVKHRVALLPGTGILIEHVMFNVEIGYQIELHPAINP